jgi:hypothetical protein
LAKIRSSTDDSWAVGAGSAARANRPQSDAGARKRKAITTTVNRCSNGMAAPNLKKSDRGDGTEVIS